MSTTNVRPYADTKLSRFLDEYIDRKVDRSHREIARAAGWTQSNMVTMIKKGDTRLPLDRVTAFARAIGVDPLFLFRLALEQFMPDDEATAKMLEFLCTENEVEILTVVRKASGGADPKLTDEQRKILTEAFSK